MHFFVTDVHHLVQWTLVYSKSFYMSAQIIRTACFNHCVIENCWHCYHTHTVPLIGSQVLEKQCLVPSSKISSEQNYVHYGALVASSLSWKS